MTNQPTSVCAGGEHSLFYNAKQQSLFSAGACGLGWCRQHPLTDALFSLRHVPLGSKHQDEESQTSESSNNNAQQHHSTTEEPCSNLFYASYYHNLAVGARTGKLYSWGCGTFTEGANMDGVIPALGQGRTATDLGQLPKPVYIPTKNRNENNDPIVQLSGGAYHSIVLTRSNRLLTFGAGQLGQLGRPTTDVDASGLPVDPTPAPVVGIPATETVSQIGAGFYNTLATCRSGALYCAGENQNQQCGSGPKNLLKMTRVKELEVETGGRDIVESAQGGYCHTLVKTLAGKVFSMGCGEEGQRGLGRATTNDEHDDDDDDIQLPVISTVDLPGGHTATQVAAGANHSVVLGSNGVAYTFGANDVGQCGVPSDDNNGDDDDEGGGLVWSPQAVDIPGRVVQVSAGYAHTVLTTETGHVFAFGQNDNGQLGIGNGTRITDGEEEERPPALCPVEVPPLETVVGGA